MKQKLKFERGSGNVFRDVGFPPDEAHNLLLRAELMLRVECLVKDRKLTKSAAAKTFGILHRFVELLACSGQQLLRDIPQRFQFIVCNSI